jgi:hypothetical protein
MHQLAKQKITVRDSRIDEVLHCPPARSLNVRSGGIKRPLGVAMVAVEVDLGRMEEALELAALPYSTGMSLKARSTFTP